MCGKWSKSSIPICLSIESENIYNWFSKQQQIYYTRIKELLLEDNLNINDEIPESINKAKILYSSCLNTSINFYNTLNSFMENSTPTGPNLNLRVTKIGTKYIFLKVKLKINMCTIV